MELQEKETQNIKAYRKSLYKEPPVNRCLLIVQSFTKYLRPTLVFIKNSTLQKMFNLFFKSCLLALTKFLFWQEDWALGYYSMQFGHFPLISSFP